MNNKSILLLILVAALALSACGRTAPPETVSRSECPAPTDTLPPTDPATVPAEEPTVPVTDPLHSALYIPDLGVEDVITYFNEVCLDAEFVNGGDATLLQKWTVPIRYALHGTYTEEDLATLTGFTHWLNTIEGFPGIAEAGEDEPVNLEIHFCTSPEMTELMGEQYSNMDGAVTFWYMDNEIYDGIICCLTDLHQTLRNSVILEELYNGLGPVQDTSLRADSIIYAEYSEPQSLTEMDELILKLLYHPQLLCGMDAAECEAVIRQLYY